MSTKKPSHVTMVRIPDELWQRVKKYQQKQMKATGFPITFSAALKVLIDKGLASL